MYLRFRVLLLWRSCHLHLKYEQMNAIASCESVLLSSSAKCIEFGLTMHPVENIDLVFLKFLVAMSSKVCLHKPVCMCVVK